MNGFWIASLRAAMLFAVVVIALLAFAAAEITNVNGFDGGKDSEWTVAASAKPDAAELAVAVPDQRAAQMQQKPASDDRESGTWLLMVFGLGAVAFALRGRRSERALSQFA